MQYENELLRKNHATKGRCAKIQNFFSHLNLLLLKNFLVFSRNYISTLFVLFSPLFICLLLLLLQYIANSVANENEINPPITKNPNLPRCTGEDCVTLGYGIIGEKTEWIDYALEYVAKKNGLNETSDFKLIYQGEESQPYFDYLSQNPNKTMIGALFCTLPEIIIPFNMSKTSTSIKLSCNDLSFFLRSNEYLYTYSIVYNKSFLPSTFFASQTISAPKDIRAFALKLSIDNALVSYTRAIKKGGFVYRKGDVFIDDSIEILVQDYPKAPNRLLQNVDIVGAYGAFYFLIPPLFIFLTIQNEIVGEKEKKLRQYLNIVGVSHKSYWISWFLTSTIFSLLISLSITVFGYIFSFNFFLDTPFLMILLLFFIFSLSMQFVSYFISVLVSNLKMSNIVSYSFLLFAWVIEILMSNIALIYQLYNDQNAEWVVWFRRFLTLYPPFNFSKAFGDISQKSGYHFDFLQNRWVRGPGFEWGDMLDPIQGEMSFEGTHYTAPRTLDSFIYILMDAVFFAILSWYFDHVVSHNRGHSLNVLFFLTPNYWCKKKVFFKKRRNESRLEDSLSFPINNESLMNSAQEEKERVINNDSDNMEVKGIRLINVCRTFRKNLCGCPSKNDVKAVKNIYLEIDQKELITFLGHNGAGKTTLINMMIGILNTSRGKIFINNLNIEDDLEEIRTILGVCPQFDILWDQLTAKEHLKLFCKIKKIPDAMIERIINEKLEEVSLGYVKNAVVKTFSGGMKRRLSMTISCIGDPKIIFLDEPTTGMDPKSRREVFKQINFFLIIC